LAGKKIEDLSEEQQDMLEAIAAGFNKGGKRILQRLFNWYVNTLNKGVDSFMDWIQRRKGDTNSLETMTLNDLKEAADDERAGSMEGERGRGEFSSDLTNEDEMSLATGPTATDGGKPGQFHDEHLASRPAGFIGGDEAVGEEVKPAPRDEADSFIERNVSPYAGPIQRNSKGTYYLLHHGRAYTAEDIPSLDHKTLDDIYRDTLESGDTGSPDMRKLQDYINQEFEWANTRWPTKTTETEVQ
jgi:hypothetical protein